MYKNLTFLLILIFSLNGCSNDDICSDDTPTTPKLIITFRNAINPLLYKTVSKLTVETDYPTSVTILAATDTDSIAIPIKTDENSTRFRFIKNGGTDQEITEIYSFSYQQNAIYVSKACGFKTNYNTLATQEEDENPVDWIISNVILKTTVEDETEAHITFFH